MVKLHKINILFLLLSILLISCRNDAGSKDIFFIKAENLYNQGRLADAKKAFEKSLRRRPDSVETHLNLGKIAISTEDYVSALYHYQKYLELAPDSQDSVIVKNWLEQAKKVYIGKESPFSSGNKSDAELIKTLRQLNTRVLELEYKIEDLSGKNKQLQEQNKLLTDANIKLKASLQKKPVKESKVIQAGTAGYSLHTVKKGDSLSRISKQYYGTEAYWPYLRDYNSSVLKGSVNLSPGMTIHIPPVSKFVEKE